MEAPKVEELAWQIHAVYCQYHKDVRGSEYWTKGNYDLLDEQTKEADRYMARFILSRESDYDALEKEAVEYAEQLIDAVTTGVVLGGVSSPEHAAELEALLIKLDTFLAKHKEGK